MTNDAVSSILDTAGGADGWMGVWDHDKTGIWVDSMFVLVSLRPKLTQKCVSSVFSLFTFRARGGALARSWRLRVAVDFVYKPVYYWS